MQEANELKVHEVYDIDEDEIHLREGSYWESVTKFYSDVKNKNETDLTNGQRAWLQKIEKSLNEEIN